MTPEEIEPNIPVYLKARPGKIGMLTGNKMEALVLMVEVDWGESREYEQAESLDVRRQEQGANFEAVVKQGLYGTVEDLRNRVTHEKLKGTLTDVFYSMKTSEIDFYSHQFKPVLKFINSPTNRLLIADEVGLGKTIEAGLIWTEYQARSNARRLLVVCPPTLCKKWERELQERFQLPVRIGNAAQLYELMQEYDRLGNSQSFVFITSYHALRPYKHERKSLDSLLSPSSRSNKEIDESELKGRALLLKRLIEWDESTPFIDMVVFDEAHSMKNTASASHIVGDVYAAASGATLCLSATPIHNKSRDLYALLRLIDPDMFREQFTFDSLLERNRPVVKLSNLLGRETIDVQAAIESAGELPDSAVKERVISLLTTFGNTPAQKVELRRELEVLNELGGFINRTRKRDVMDARVRREPNVIPVELTPQEKKFYEGVLQLIRKQVRERGEELTSFHLISPALLMASSIPVIVERMRSEEKWGGIEELADMESAMELDLELEFTDDEEGDENLSELSGFEWVLEHDFEKEDTKYQALHDDLLTRVEEGKIVLFAFFKDTIRYLQRRLERDGFKVLSVTGDIKDRAVRDKMLQDFAIDQNQVLLCSEVGAEGVDLQFCRIVINYDLPWNPMRVEQRIGRIDRIGQEAKSIVIVNFWVKGTIDGSIYHHLYEKIGIFQSTIGDLEGIIGEEVSRLTTRLLRDDLTDEAVAEMAEQTAVAIEERRKIEAELEESSGALLAHKDYLDDQVGNSTRLGRFIKPGELRRHIDWFFPVHFSGSNACELMWDTPEEDCLKINLSFAAWDAFDTFLKEESLPLPSGFNPRKRDATLTLDPDRFKLLKNEFRRLILVNHVHPFIRWIIATNRDKANQWHGVSGARLTSEHCEPGRYFYLIYRQTLEGLLRREEFFYALKNIDTSALITGAEAEAIMNDVLDRGGNLYPESPPDYSRDFRELKEVIGNECKKSENLYVEEMELKMESRRKQVTNHFGRKLEVDANRLETMRQSTEDRTRMIKMVEGSIAKWERLLGKELEKLGRAKNYSPRLGEIACGILEVGHE